MNKLEENGAVNLGATKYVYSIDEAGYISKVFKTKRQTLPIEQQRKIIEMKKKYMGEYIPETRLIDTEDGGYIIRQKFIEGKTLAETNISSLSAETLSKLLDLIKKYLKYHKEQGGDMDITGYQYYPGNPSAIRRKIMNFLKINQNFLASTNIIIGEDGNPYMVDVCESASPRLQGKLKNFLARPFIKRTISSLEKTLQNRINFENENINKELLSTLDG